MTQDRIPTEASWGEIARKTVSNTAWSYLGFVFGKGATFVATIILANLLLPEQFGLLGFCILGMQFCDVLSRFGLDSALISRGKSAEIDGNTIFVFGLALACLVYCLAWLTAPWLAEFFREPEVELLFRVLAIGVVIEALALVHRAILSVQLRFKAKLVPKVGRSLVKGAVSIVLALNGSGVWALVWGQLAGAVFATIANWWICSWRPGLVFNRHAGFEMARYGSSMIVVEVMGALRSNLDYIIVGRSLGATALGLYTIAYRLPELVVRGVNGAVGGVAHPVLVGLREDPEHIRYYYTSYMRYLSLLTLPIGVGVAVISKPFVHTFYGENWVDAIFPMQAVSVALAISSVGYAPGVLYKALNRPDILRNLSLVKVPIMALCLWYALRWGVRGVALMQVALAIFYLALDSVVVGRFVELPIRGMLRALVPSVVGSIGMAWIGGSLSAIMIDDNALELICIILVCVPTYILIVRLVSPSAFFDTIHLLKSFRGSRSSGNNLANKS